MITWNNALTHVAAWCKANPGQNFRIHDDQLNNMHETPDTLETWAALHGLQAVRESQPVIGSYWHISTTEPT